MSENKTVPALSTVRYDYDGTMPQEYRRIPQIACIAGPGKSEIATGLMNLAERVRDSPGSLQIQR
jgi:hypothetical protein